MQKEIEARWPDVAAALAEIKRLHPDDALRSTRSAGRSRLPAIDQGASPRSRAPRRSDTSRSATARAAAVHRRRPPGVREARRRAETIIEKFDRDLAGTAEHAEATATTTKRTGLIVGFVAVALGIALAIVITRTVTGPVRLLLDRMATLRDQDVAELGTGLEGLAEGDLSLDVQPIDRRHRRHRDRRARPRVAAVRRDPRPAGRLDRVLQRLA